MRSFYRRRISEVLTDAKRTANLLGSEAYNEPTLEPARTEAIESAQALVRWLDELNFLIETEH